MQHRIRAAAAAAIFAAALGTAGPVAASTPDGIGYCTPPRTPVPSPRVSAGPTFTQLAKLISTDGATGDTDGISVAISGNTVAIGAPGNDGGEGAVYVFTESAGGWADMTQTAKLTASNAEPGDSLGQSVAIDGATIVAGAPFAGLSGQGAVYVFTKPGGGWANENQAAELTSSDGVDGALLGNSVAIAGNTIVAGAPSTGAGAAYVFTEPGGGWANGTETAKLTASDGATGDAFGTSVGISGNTVVAGAPLDQIGFDNAQGAAYVFTEPGGGWANENQAAKLTATDGAASDYLGNSVGISGNTVVAGAPYATVTNGNQGAAYVFTEPGGGWANENQAAKLTASDGGVNDNLGFAAAISGNTVVAGAPRGGISCAFDKGAAYVFTEPGGGWADENQAAELTASDGVFDALGTSVAIDGTTIAAGAPAANIGENDDQGAAYVFGAHAAPPPRGLRLSGFLTPGRGAHRRAGSAVLVRTRAEYTDGSPIPGWLGAELARGCALTVRASGAQSTPARCMRWNAARQRFFWTWKTHSRPTGIVILTVQLDYHFRSSSLSERIVLTRHNRGRR